MTLIAIDGDDGDGDDGDGDGDDGDGNGNTFFSHGRAFGARKTTPDSELPRLIGEQKSNLITFLAALCLPWLLTVLAY